MPKGLRLSADRERAILENTGEPFYFEHEQITDVDEFRDGISENQIDVNPFGIPLYATLQANEGARGKIRELDKVIERAAKDSNVHPDFLRAIIYTEESRGWYDHWTKYVRESSTWLPGNVLKKWEALIPGSDFEDTEDNIRITVELVARIAKSVNPPYPEDIYALYNSLAHDRTYRNAQTKTTPHYFRQVLREKAWTKPRWHMATRYPDNTLRDVLPFGPDAGWQHHAPFLDPASDTRFWGGPSYGPEILDSKPISGGGVRPWQTMIPNWENFAPNFDGDGFQPPRRRPPDRRGALPSTGDFAALLNPLATAAPHKGTVRMPLTSDAGFSAAAPERPQRISRPRRIVARQEPVTEFKFW